MTPAERQVQARNDILARKQAASERRRQAAERSIKTAQAQDKERAPQGGDDHGAAHAAAAKASAEAHAHASSLASAGRSQEGASAAANKSYFLQMRERALAAKAAAGGS